MLLKPFHLCLSAMGFMVVAAALGANTRGELLLKQQGSPSSWAIMSEAEPARP